MFLYMHTPTQLLYLLLCPPAVPLCSAVNPHILHPDQGPLCRGTRWTADRGPNIPERLCFRAPAALWDLLSWPLERDNSIQRARSESGSAPRCRCCRCAKWSAHTVRVRAVDAHRPARPPDCRYKTEAPGSPKALREAGGRRVPLQSSSSKVPI